MYECNVTLNRPLAEAETAAPDARLAEKLGTVNGVDVQAMFRNKIGEAVPPHRIPRACNPVRADRVIAEEPNAGVPLPCSLERRADSDDCILVRILEPVAVLGPSDAATAPAARWRCWNSNRSSPGIKAE